MGGDSVVAECEPTAAADLLACLSAPGSCELSVSGCAPDPDAPCVVAYCGLDGRCATQSVTCDDSDPCTEDRCEPGSAEGTGGCVHEVRSCETSADPCSVGTCDPQSGACVVEPRACDDGIACTDDSCDPALGCVHAPVHSRCALAERWEPPSCWGTECDVALGCVALPVAGSCHDGDPCTVSAHCEAGTCVATEVTDCDDDEPCTEDHCVGGGDCVHVHVLCDDGDVCTDDFCGLGLGCFSAPVDCDDGDACTDDDCAAPMGCVHAPKICDDLNPCTSNACDSRWGCVFAPDVCDDGDACTLDTCTDKGECSHEAVSCADGSVCTADACDPAIGCTFDPLPCSSPACTVPFCHPLLGCLHEPVKCPEGGPCEVSLGCLGNACQYEVSCDDGDLCTYDGCEPGVGCVHTAVYCDDDDTSTIDFCEPDVGCVFEPAGDPICTLWGAPNEEVHCPVRILRESNMDDWYARSTNVKFRFDNQKLTMLAWEAPIEFPGIPPFWVEVPGSALQSGHEAFLPPSLEDQNEMGGGNAWFANFSAPHTPLTLAYLDDDEIIGEPTFLWFRLRLEVDVPEASPLHIYTPHFHIGTPLGGAYGRYVWNEMLFIPDRECDVSADCDDGNTCTANYCNNGACTGGAFQLGAKIGSMCFAHCNVELGIVEEVPCDDGDACTLDYCDEWDLECVFEPIDPDDGDACTADFCDPVYGIFHLPAECDDGSECTDDECVAGLGCVNTPNGCDDGVACTVDACEHAPNGQHTCSHTPDPAACNVDPAKPTHTCSPNALGADAQGCVAL